MAQRPRPFKGVDTDVIACRGPLKHAWDLVPHADIGDVGRRSRRITDADLLFRCLHGCGTEKVVVINSITGRVEVGPYYRRTKDYSLPEARLGRSQTLSEALNVEFLARMKEPKRQAKTSRRLRAVS